MQRLLRANLVVLCMGSSIGLAPGCGDDDPSDTLRRDELVAELLAGRQESPGAAGREKEHTLVLGLRAIPRSFDPLGELDPWAMRAVDDLLFEGLTRATSDVAPFAVPALADQCLVEPPEAPRDVYCHLRPGVVFHDGSELTVADVVYSLEFWLDPRRTNIRQRYGLTGLRKIEVMDRPRIGRAQERAGDAARDPGRWIRIGFAGSEPLALELLSVMKIVPKAARRGRSTQFGKAPIGTGPMRWVATEDDRVIFERIAAPEASSGPTQSSQAVSRVVSRIVLREVADGAARLSALRRGELHIVPQVAPLHVPVELAKPGMAPRFSAFLLTPPRFDIVLYNMRSGAQAGPRLREALDQTIPRGALEPTFGSPPALAPTIVDLHDPTPIDLQILADAGVSAKMGMAGLPTWPERDDVAQALAAGLTLDALGWPRQRGLRRKPAGSLRLTLTWSGGSGEQRRLATALRDAWREQGIVIPFATASWAYVLGLMRRGEFALGLVRLATRSDADLYPFLHSRGAQNICGIADASLDAALEAYRAAADRSQRRVAKQQISDRLDELRPLSLVHAPTQVMLVSRRVEGLEFVDDLPRLSTIELGPQRSWIAGGE